VVALSLGNRFNMSPRPDHAAAGVADDYLKDADGRELWALRGLAVVHDLIRVNDCRTDPVTL